MEGRPILWPVPNRCVWHDGVLDLQAAVRLEADPEFSGELIHAQRILNEFSVASNASAPLCLRLQKQPVEGREAYGLTIRPDGVTVSAGTPDGAFYGLQTLLQILYQCGKSAIPLLEIADAPFKPVRGVHFYIPAREQLPWFFRFIDFLARYKYNTVFLEIGAAVEFESHPEINKAWERFCAEMMVYPKGPDGSGMQHSVGHFKDSVHIENGGRSYLTKDEFREIIRYMKSRHIEVIPEVQGLAHTYWMLLAHRECAERADDPYPDTYCISNPKTYEIYFDCLSEIVEMVRPKVVHIGHDEWYTIGLCPECSKKTGHDILLQDIVKIHGWLAERGIRTILWGDKLFRFLDGRGFKNGGLERVNYDKRYRKGEIMRATYRAADLVPDDLMILDWYHSLEGGDTGSEDYFAHHGLEVIYGNFSGTMEHLEDRLRRPNVSGAELSLWQDVSDNGLVIAGNLSCYFDVANILWSSQYRVNQRAEAAMTIARLYPAERDRMNRRTPPSRTSGTFACVDIAPYCNRPASYIQGLDFVGDCDEFPGSPPFDFKARMSSADDTKPCLMVAGTGGHPSFPVELTCRSLVFLHTYTADMQLWNLYIEREKSLVGRYLIEYEDASTEEALIEHARNITTLNKRFCLHEANPAYLRCNRTERVKKGRVSESVEYGYDLQSLFSYEWVNPHPEKKIRRVRIHAQAGRPGEVALLAVTAVR